MTYAEALRRGERQLCGVCPEAELNAWYLFSYCFHMEKSEYFLRQNETAPEEPWAVYQICLDKRKKRIPLEYITHGTEFMGLPFYVDEHVLIPRQDTECLVEEVLNFSKGRDILDLCTGSGCIGISLAVLGKCKSVTMADISEAALVVAEKNAEDNKAEVRLIQSNLFEKITGSFDIIVSNPPYIPTGDMEALMPEVRDHEPGLALDGSMDGLYFYRAIIRQAGAFLREKGKLCMEIGCEQGQAVKTLLADEYEQIEIKKDLAGLNRVILAQRI